MRTGGLRGSAFERDPQGSNAVVVAQEPPAGVLVPPGSVVAFRTRTDVQPYGTARRLRWCRPGNGMVRCQVRLGVPAEGVWTARIAKRSSPPAAVEVTVTFTPS